MAGDLKGSPQLLARLKALKLAFKPMGKDWATQSAQQSGRSAPRGKTGNLARSFRVRTATQRRAVVDAIWYAKFPNKGTKAHTITPKAGGFLIFNVGGNTIFAKKVSHRGNRGTGFVYKAVHKALDDHVSKDALIDAWNKAA